jgi:hypothetical protein
VRFDCSGLTTVDWTHNSWYPDYKFRLPHGSTFYTGNNLAHLKSIMPSGTPVLGGLPKLYEDNITVSNPWTTTITLGSPIAGTVEYMGTEYPVVADGDAAKNSGVHIQNITDSYSGVAPDRGAVVAGRSPPVYGDRT